ncbi:uncharacterized protein [Zea mays]|uniref:uncharacterized protein isoform X2 n=1 Tax=Zea mays TaxID=4577 RepID=UPI0009A94DFE|nr:uncharacterized protein LOC100280564 isoform X2 [Zea mays]|eukprot:XP_020403280.1 uncharacterized protein LOC100280564 isoform X2 [Zea mays]
MGPCWPRKARTHETQEYSRTGHSRRLFVFLPVRVGERRGVSGVRTAAVDSDSVTATRRSPKLPSPQVLVGMASTACFVIVSKNDIPIYEAEVGSAPKKEDLSYHHQFILHAALDVVQDLAWTTNAIFMLLHDSRSEDGIKSFFQEVHELYIKIFLNPLYLPGSRITSSHFDTKVRALARRYL